MSVYFSDNLAAAAANTTLVTGFKASVGIRHARERTSVARVTSMALTTDTVRMLTLKSSDRLLALELASDGGSTAGEVNIGIYLTGAAHDGAVVDVDVFAAAQSVATEIDLTDIFVQATTLDGVDRGKELWAIAAVGAGTDTEDPRVDYDIVIVPSTSLSVAVSELTLVATYTAGD